MSTPIVCLLAFAAWTLLTLALTVGSYRWGRILTRRAGFRDFGEYQIEGPAWYRRGMRAHANCVENLPIFAAIVVVVFAADLHSLTLDVLSLIVIGARIPHTLVHVSFEQTETVVRLRSLLYNTQFLAMAAMIVVIVARVAS